MELTFALPPSNSGSSNSKTGSIAIQCDAHPIEDEHVVLELDCGATGAASMIGSTSHFCTLGSLSTSNKQSSTAPDWIPPSAISHKVGVSRPIFHVSLFMQTTLRFCASDIDKCAYTFHA